MPSDPTSSTLRNRLDALDAATRAIAAVLDLEPVLQLIVDRVRDLIDTRYAALGIVDHEGVIERFITSGLSPGERERIGALPRGHGLLGLIIREGRSIRVPDIAGDPRRSGFPPNHPDMRIFLGVPILIRDQSVGNLYLTDPADGRPFTDDDEDLVELFALHCGIAIENARLHEQVRRLAIVDERTRIGRDLHDGIIQSIYAVGLSLEDVPEMMAGEPDEARARIDRAITSLDATIHDIRRYILELRPELLEGAELAGELRDLIAAFRADTAIDVGLDVRESSQADVSRDEMVELLAIAREALTNTARHAKARRVSVILGGGPNGLRLEIADDGIGFDPAVVPTLEHQGLANIRSRAERIGAALTIESARGSGARIIVTLPAADSGRSDLGATSA